TFPIRSSPAGRVDPRLSNASACASALDGQSNSHSTADAERRQSLLRVAPHHFVQQGDENAGTRCADRMADGDGAAIDVDPGGIPVDALVDGAGLRGERLVGLDQVEVLGRPASLL